MKDAELAREVTALSQRLAQDLTESLKLAEQYRKLDPSSSLTKVRIVAEGILMDVIERSSEKGPSKKSSLKQPTLDNLISHPYVKKRIEKERKVRAKLITIQNFGNIGAHYHKAGEPLKAKDARTGLEALVDVAQWYPPLFPLLLGKR